MGIRREEYAFGFKYSAEELRKRRQALGMSASDLAAALGTSPAWVFRAEKGQGMLGMKPYFLVDRYLRILGITEEKAQSA